MSSINVTNIKHPSSASNNIVLDSSGNVVLQAGSASTPALQPSGDTNTGIFFPAADTIAFAEGGAEAARIDSSGRLLVGTSSTSSVTTLLLQGYSGTTGPGVLRCCTTTSGPSSAEDLGYLAFGDATHVSAAWILAQRDGGTWTAGSSHPGRLVFSTTADGASSPTERMRINSAGTIDMTNNILLSVRATARTALYVGRETDDGNLVEFFQAGSLEGAISVSGSTVTYGGGHLARWSQLPNEEAPSGLLKGTVMSNLDEMCEWGDEDNEQLNKTKVSDIEGDPNIAGVFVSTSFDEIGPLDFFVAMTGDMIIRIAEGVTVQRGDLLMSAGDGTAKPQDDDIIRSKTVAKVTSTHVTCTYDDGSYCVPCVLMAC